MYNYYFFHVEIPTKEEDKLGQATPRMTVTTQNKHEPRPTEIGLQPVATSIVTNFTPLHADNVQQKLNNEYVFGLIYNRRRRKCNFFWSFRTLNKNITLNFLRSHLLMTSISVPNHLLCVDYENKAVRWSLVFGLSHTISSALWQKLFEDLKRQMKPLTSQCSCTYIFLNQ